MHPSSIDDKEWIDERIAAQAFDTSQKPRSSGIYNSESPASVAFPFYCHRTVKGLMYKTEENHLQLGSIRLLPFMCYNYFVWNPSLFYFPLIPSKCSQEISCVSSRWRTMLDAHSLLPACTFVVMAVYRKRDRTPVKSILIMTG